MSTPLNFQPTSQQSIKRQREKTYDYKVTYSRSLLSAYCLYNVCGHRVQSLAVPSPSRGITGVPLLCMVGAGGSSRGRSLLTVPQVLLCFWCSAGTQQVEVQQVVLQADWQGQSPDKPVRSQTFSPQDGADLKATKVRQGRNVG